MYDTSGSYSVCYAAPPDYNDAGRLSWLRGELARQEAPRKAPTVADEWRALRAVALGDALTTAEAYEWFGTFLGLFPPFAIFARILDGFYAREVPFTNGFLLWSLLFLSMTAVCCFVGRKLGRAVGHKLGDPRALSLPVLLLCSVMMAVLWGVVTGAAGGAVGFIVGAFFGMVCAVPVALAAFPVFALLHRALSRDGIIEERRLWPLVFGLPVIAAAMILSPWIK
jgi:hypothetical protein